MAKTTEKIILGILVILVFSISSLLIGAQTTGSTEGQNKHQAAGGITPEQAKVTALSAVPGTITNFEYGIEGRTAVYEVEIESDGKKNEVLVEKKTGNIFAIETGESEEDEEIVQSELIISAGITEEKAKQIAVDAVGGTVIKVSMEKEGGIVLYEIELLVNGEKAEVEVDAENGDVIEVEWGDD